MSIAIDEFWKRAVASRLLTADRCRQLNDEFAALQTAPQPSGALPLAQWLAANGVLTRQQASMLLAPPSGRGLPANPATQPRPQTSKPSAPPSQRGSKHANPPPRPTNPAAIPKPQPETNWELPASNFDVTRGRRGGRKVSISALVSAGAGLALVSAIILTGLVLSSGNQPPDKPDSTVATVDHRPGGDASSAVEPVESLEPARLASKPLASEVDDDGKTLWMSPTAGQPPAIDYLPSGVQLLLIVRLAEVLENVEGAKVVDALGPAAGWATSELRAILGVELSNVEQLIVAFHADDAGLPQAAYVARLRTPLAEGALPKAWGAVKPQQHKSKSFLQGIQWAYYLPSEGQGRVVAIAPPATMKDILELDGPPPLRKGIEKLLRHTDAARHFNLLAAPSYLWADGKSLLTGELARLRDPLAHTFDESIEAVLASAHLGEDLFVELRASVHVDHDPVQLAQQLARRLSQAGDEIERFVASVEAHPHGRLVLNRFPRMVQLLCDYTRFGAEDRQVVLRSYLPLAAAHNLTLGAELALAQYPPAATAAVKPEKPPTGAAAALERRVSLSFPRETLERCLELLSKEIDIPIVILGSDLQLEGITKNQSFGLDLRDRSAEEILREVLKLANPDGKLVYVIRSKDGNGEAIFITTRSAAAKLGEQLPKALRGPPPEKS